MYLGRSLPLDAIGIRQLLPTTLCTPVYYAQQWAEELSFGVY
jgi:hypothetical protein